MKSSPFPSHGMRMGIGLKNYLTPSNLSDDAREIIQAIKDDILTIEGSKDHGNYRIDEHNILKASFSHKGLFVLDSGMYHINGYQFAFEVLQKIGEVNSTSDNNQFGVWQDTDIFSPIYLIDPEIFKNNIRITYDIFGEEFCITAPFTKNALKNSGGCHTYKYKSLSEAIKKKHEIHLMLQDLYVQHMAAHSRYSQAIESLLSYIQELDIKAYASLTSLERDAAFPPDLEGVKVEIHPGQWQIRDYMVDNRLLRVHELGLCSGTMRVCYKGIYYNGVTVFKNEDVEKLVALAREKKSLLQEQHKLDAVHDIFAKFVEDAHARKQENPDLNIAYIRTDLGGKYEIADYSKKELKEAILYFYSAKKTVTGRIFEEIWDQYISENEFPTLRKNGVKSIPKEKGFENIFIPPEK